MVEIVNPRRDFMVATYAAAQQSGHIFPAYATCEAALESGYGASVLAREGGNLFGMKQHTHPVYGTLALPTHEWRQAHQDFEPATAEWVKYPTLESCFADRMDTLTRLSKLTKPDTCELVYPHYAAAITANDGEQFVLEVSKSWSTDPRRAIKVLQVHQQFSSVFG